MSNRFTTIIALSLLLFVFVICVLSIRNDSATMDEVAHLPAGYSYLTQKDMRLNPEHPPLIKDLAALPLLFIKGIKFPFDIPAWKEYINGQWDFGFHFLYAMDNPVDKMIFLARIPMIFVLVILGFFIFKWARELWGDETAILALFLFSFSPTLLAHGRLVTTDVGAAFGVFFATYYFVKALKNPIRKNIITAGLSFGIAQLLKFTAILLVPFFAILTLIWALLLFRNLKNSEINKEHEPVGRVRMFKSGEKRNNRLKLFTVHCSLFAVVLIIGFSLVWLFYTYHVINYPPERQAHDIKSLLSSHQIPFSGPLLAKMARIPILRAFAQYLLGLLMVFQRATFGHTTYFLGQVSASGWKIYFPTVYLIKESLAFHILTLIAILFSALSVKKVFWKNTCQRCKNWLNNHFPEFSMLCFICLYWTSSLTSNLNIGVRHLLPVFPFTILLVSKGIVGWIKKPLFFSKRAKYIILAFLMFWQAISVILIYPHFLAYFNEIVGGPDKGYIYVVDSNLDWGQDLKRLKQWVDKNNIEKIYVNYFGGGNAEYYLKEKYLPWWGDRDPKELEKPSYLAVSASFLQGGRGEPAPGFNQSFGYYHWLDQYEPVAKIGYSIFVYYLK